MTEGDILVRADICADCPTPCERQKDAQWHADPCASCPLTPPRWGQFDCGKLRGLGDLVAVFADPIARKIGLDKAKCGCAKRQDALNRLLPFT